MRLSECKVIRASGIPDGATEPRALTAEEINALAAASGELRRNGTQWASEYGQTPGWRCVSAEVDPDAVDEPAFSPNTRPTDSDGRPLAPGDYEVRRGGQVQLATVFESEDCELLVRFAGSDRTQRVDECARHVSWQRITASDRR